MSTRRGTTEATGSAGASVRELPISPREPATAPTAEGKAPVNVAGLQEQIRMTRKQPGETVAASAAKTDVRARSSAVVARTAARVTGEPRRAGTPIRANVTDAATTARDRVAPAVRAAGH